MKEMYTLVYDSKVSIIGQHIMVMKERQERLASIGMKLVDDIFRLILPNLGRAVSKI